MSATAVTRYHLLLRMLHWMIAVCVVLQLSVGFLVLANLPNTAEKFVPLTAHIGIGLAIGVLMALRLIVRFSTRRPPPVTAGNATLNGLRRLTHFLFYVVVLSMVSTGVGVAVLANLFPVLFGAGGPMPENFSQYPPFAGHETFAIVLLVLLALHVIGTVYHQFILKDRLFLRMWFGKAGNGRKYAATAQSGHRS